MLICKNCKKETTLANIIKKDLVCECGYDRFDFQEPVNKKFADFTQWFSDGEKSFIGRHGRFVPSNPLYWLNRVEEKHSRLRTILGAEKVSQTINLEKEQEILNIKDIKAQIDGILHIIPNYLSDNNFDINVFASPYIQLGTHNAIKLSKHVITYASNFLRRIHGTEECVQRIKNIERLLSEIGKELSKKQVTAQQLEVTLSTTHKAFALLGHYGPDEDSCFNQSSDKPSHKYILAQSENTFVITIAGENKKGKIKNLARAFGWFDNSFNVANVSNYYARSEISEGNAIKCLKIFFSTLLQKEVNFIPDVARIRGNNRAIFHNPYGRWTFIAKNYKSQSDQDYTLTPFENCINKYLCDICGMEKDHLIDIDGKVACTSCIAKMDVCQITGKKHIASKIKEFELNSQNIKVYDELIKDFKQCKCCQEVYTNEELCSFCQIATMSECDFCHESKIDEEIIDIGDLCVCHSCLKKNTELQLILEDLEEVSSINDI